MLTKQFLLAIAREYNLSPAETEAFVLVFGNEKGMEAVADELEISPTALRVRLSAVYKKFNINESGSRKLTKLQQFLEGKYIEFDKRGIDSVKPEYFWLGEPLSENRTDQLILQQESLDWALEHAVRIGDTDLLPIPFEYQAIKYNWPAIRQYLLDQNLFEWEVRPYITLLAPKKGYRYAFRDISQIDPLDFIIFAAIIKEIGRDIESIRIPIQNKIVFSNRFLPKKNGQIFDIQIGYLQFEEEIQNIIEQQPDFTHILLVDITSFYQRIHLPSLQKVLSYISKFSMHIKVLMNMLKGWSITEDYGIPVGTAPARLLAEAAISKVDEALLANGVKFVRYVDDFRIFASSRTEAYRYLAFMTEILKANHFEVQSEKTDILSIKSYQEVFSRKKESQKNNAKILDNIYKDVDTNSNTKNKEKNIVLVNEIVQLLRKQLNSEREKSDLGIVKTGLRSLRKFKDDSIVNEILDDDKLVLILPAFGDIIKYLQNLELVLNLARREEIGSLILELVEDSIISELEYYRIWALDLFAISDRWGNHKKLISLLGADLEISRRQLILALGIAKQRDWLLHIKLRKLSNESPWTRRALLAAARCLPDDIREHWFKSVELQLGDVLDKAVTKWAMENPLPNKITSDDSNPY
ncbi:RNA-directed DNA polymerase [Nostoc sp. 2RC]|uniref:RNA-directed DNA polymerase n=1 Tax=Nostoc sp. 2RC TaxID=2485484 RepID=UPI0016297D4E|nr:RNA-directed DNA polymerase [Nostoc sp. 2RC]MBC1235631.1 RNA-directed DNA polymerase [Nostoc sp. 2RC]